MQLLIAFVVTGITFLILDALWLGLVAKDFYASHMEGLMKENPNMIAAALFYVLYVTGIVYFTIFPYLATGHAGQVIFSAALFGLIAYATYDLTGLAVIQNWSAKLAVVDIIWGAFVTSMSGLVGYLVAVKFVSS